MGRKRGGGRLPLQSLTPLKGKMGDASHSAPAFGREDRFAPEVKARRTRQRSGGIELGGGRPDCWKENDDSNLLA